MQGSEAYDDKFYTAHVERDEEGLEKLLKIVLNFFPNTASAIDVGCSVGNFLRILQRLRGGGGLDIQGIDGPWVPREKLLIPPAAFMEWDFSKNFPVIEKKYDLAMSLEVAEHLPPEKADDFVRFICSLSSVILFSAAIPGQGGTNHYNEQWPEYWAEKFRAAGYVTLDALRPHILAEERMPDHYRQNVFIAVHHSQYSAEKFSGIAHHILGMIHPDRFRYIQDKLLYTKWKKTWAGRLNSPVRAFKRFKKRLRNLS